MLFHADRRRIGGCGHFRSCDIDGGHTILSAMADNLMLLLYANLTTCFIDPELLPINVLQCKDRYFRVFLRKIAKIIEFFSSHPKNDVAVAERQSSDRLF